MKNKTVGCFLFLAILLGGIFFNSRCLAADLLNMEEGSSVTDLVGNITGTLTYMDDWDGLGAGAKISLSIPTGSILYGHEPLSLSDENYETDKEHYSDIDKRGHPSHKYEWFCVDAATTAPVANLTYSIYSAKIISINKTTGTVRIKVVLKSTTYPTSGEYQPMQGIFEIQTFSTGTTAKIKGAGNGVLYSGETFDSELKINVGNKDNIGNHTGIATPDDTEVQRIMFIVNANVNADNNKVKGSTNTTMSACDYFRNQFGSVNIDCSDLKGIKASESDYYNYSTEEDAVGILIGSLPQGINNFSVKNVPILDGDENVGKKICIAIGVKPASGDNYSNWNISDASCRTIAKKPSVAVKDGSIYAKKSITTSLSTRTSGTYGSWVEYLVVSNGAIKNLASGSTLSNGTNLSGCSLYPLTIANKQCSNGSNLGTAKITESNAFVARLANLTANDKTTIIHKTGKEDINITQNYKISGSFSDPSAIPQYIFIADEGNINISEDVTRLDAWLIAPNGTVDTCAGIEKPSSDQCTNALTINGPIYAKNLKLDRTAGVTTTPAETLDLLPATYLWAKTQSLNKTNVITNTSIHELAPRL